MARSPRTPGPATASAPRRAARAVLAFVRDRVPPTRRSLLLVGLAATGFHFYGVEQLDLVAFVVGISGLLLPVAANLLVVAATLVLWRRMRKQLPAVAGPD